MGISSISGGSSYAGTAGSSSQSTPSSTNGMTVEQANGMSSSGFANSMSTMSNKDLTTMLGSTGLSQDRKTEIANELLRRMEASKTSDAPTASTPAATPSTEDTDADETPEEKRIKELMKKKQDGTISSVEKDELASLLKQHAASTNATQGGATQTEYTV